MSPSQPLIVTLKLDQSAFQALNTLRQQHFPHERNFIPAHVTLFHALPGDQVWAIQQTLQTTCYQTSTLPLSLPQLRFLGRGTAVEIHSPELLQLRQQLAAQWQQWLSPQDQQKYRPHVTIQNKVSPPEAHQLYDQLTAAWTPFEATGEGLLLWRYQGGPWEAIHEFLFQSSQPSSI